MGILFSAKNYKFITALQIFAYIATVVLFFIMVSAKFCNDWVIAYWI